MNGEIARTDRHFCIKMAWQDVAEAMFGNLIVARQLRAFVNREWSIARDAPTDLPGIVLIHQRHAYGVDEWLIECAAAEIVLVERGRERVRVRVAAVTDPQADAIMQRFRNALPESVPSSLAVPVVFWACDDDGPRSIVRKLDAPTWADIADNYPAPTGASLAPLFSESWQPQSGRLLLWRGEPGTGKTHAVRALMRAWRGWCSAHVVLDSEKFFGSESGYMLDVLLKHETDEDTDEASHVTRPQWRLLILEDTGELVSVDAGERAGQGLSRMLNVCDGLLGQSLNVLVLITTNERVGRLHPAIARPGRCLANVEFEPFDPAGARRWLRARGVDDADASVRAATLAELYAQLDGRAVAARSARVGFLAR